MDTKLRDLERKARSGDPDAAYRYLCETGRTDDLVKQYEAMMLLAEAQHPGLMKQLREINEMLDRVKVQEVDVAPPPWTTEIIITNTTGS